MTDEKSDSFVIGICGDIVFGERYGLKFNQFLQKITEKYIRTCLNGTFSAQTFVRIPRKNIERVLPMADIIAGIDTSPEHQIIFDGVGELYFSLPDVFGFSLL